MAEPILLFSIDWMKMARKNTRPAASSLRRVSGMRIPCDRRSDTLRAVPAGCLLVEGTKIRSASASGGPRCQTVVPSLPEGERARYGLFPSTTGLSADGLGPGAVIRDLGRPSCRRLEPLVPALRVLFQGGISASPRYVFPSDGA